MSNRNLKFKEVIKFTFQYGSNQIQFRIEGAQRGSEFTFQYGSNQIICNIIAQCTILSFTFQYGSNQIIIKVYKQNVEFNLHSNMVLIKLDEVIRVAYEEKEFTFQYGSNQIFH